MKPAGVSQPAGHSHRLTFHWPNRPQLSLPLLGFLFLSVLAHAVAFYIFQVKYPLTAAIPPPPVQVNLLAATPENQALLKWIDSEDPAAIANPHEIIPPNLNDLPYKPSFAEIRTAPKAFDEKASPIVFPSARNPLYIINSGVNHGQSVSVNPPAQNTELKFSGPLAARKIKLEPALQLVPQSNSDHLEPSTFFVGVGPDGKVQYTFLINSYPDHFGSGNDSMDQQAETHLDQIEFAPGGGGVTWGFATYFWGNDAFDSKPGPQTP